MFLELLNKKDYNIEAKQLYLELNQDNNRSHNSLTISEIKEIITERNNILVNYGLVELSVAVIKKLIKNFSSSPYIIQENYMDTVVELQEIFYYVKRETDDKLGDDMLIKLMTEKFNNDCRGSLDLLWISIERYATKFRRDNLK